MKNQELEEFLKKIKQLEKSSELDLSSDEDLSLAVMNLISIEEHLFFSYAKTKKEEFLRFLEEVRELRKAMMKMLVRREEGEVWCITKHLLSASMRLFEVGTKYLNRGEEDKARELFEKSYSLYSLFWGINLGFVDLPEIEKGEREKEELEFFSDEFDKKEKVSIFEKLGEIVRRAVDCCRE